MASSGVTYRGNAAGIKETMRTEAGIRALIEAATSAVAASAEEKFPEGFFVLEGVTTTDRFQGNVTVVNRSAEAIEGKYGYLSQSAPAGFDAVRQKGKK